MHRCTTNFDGDEGIELTDCSLKRRELEVLIREDTILGGDIGDTEGDAGLEVLFEGLEPCLPLRLLEDVMENRLGSWVR